MAGYLDKERREKRFFGLKIGGKGSEIVCEMETSRNATYDI